jgi:lysine-specific demethylase 3
MYNAFATGDTEGSKGSTRLHMDMADAVNMMVHAEPCADGTPGGARWDLFRAEDAPAIRKFLIDRFGLASGLDPIHSQQFYLDKQLRAELYAKTGVRSHQVIQRQGEAVFIPAGCAHQVCNRSIWYGMDFETHN